MVCIGGNAKKDSLRRMEYIMKNKRKGSIARNVIILTAACSWLCVSTAIAKEMDFKVNQIFSNRVVVFNQEQENLKETSISEITQEEMLEVKGEDELTPKISLL